MTLSSKDQQRLDDVAAVVAKARAQGATGTLYAHCKLATTERQTHVLFGSVPLIGQEVAVLDWQTAPLAEAFFAHGPGEPYELELGDRVINGRLLEKHVLIFEGGELSRVEWEDGAAERSAALGWRAVALQRGHVPPREAALRTPFRSPLEVKLDPAQQKIVELPREQSVLVLGEAGFGKTTVALHRLAALVERFQLRAAVMVPTEGLRRLTDVMLERRGIEGVDVLTYDGWAAKAARRVFRDLPKRDSTDATSNIIRLKRHGALESTLAEYVRRRPKPAVDPDRPSKYKSRAKRADLLHLFGDSAWMDKVVARSNGDLYPSVVADIVEHTRVQFLKTSEEEFDHVTDKELLLTVDGKAMDEGTPTSDVNTVDVEDFAVLFELERLRAEAEGATATPLGMYDVLLVDEAQEFAPLELSLMARALRPRGIVIVAGDAHQQVDATSHFLGWDAVMERLRARDYAKATLEVNYRCPPEVTQLARGIIDPNVPPPASTKSITSVSLHHPVQLALWLIDELRRLKAEDPSSSITLITRTSEAAKSLSRTLSHGVQVRLALEGDFEFRAGITLTSVPEVKGLEFDYVILPDADGRTYGTTGESRRALYVAVTRATHRLALAATGSPSPLLSRSA